MNVRSRPERESDVELLRASRRGSGGFDLFYRRYRDAVLAYFARRTSDAELAADLTAETFAAALLAVHDPVREVPGSPAPWLFSIAHHKLADSYRRGRVEDAARKKLALEPLVLDDEDIEHINETARTTDLEFLLARHLPPDQLHAVRARVLDERDYADIAREIECSQAVVRMRVSRALKTLRTTWENDHG